MTDRETELDAMRREIDVLDAELLDLLNRRGRIVFEVAAVKHCEGEPRYYRPEREAALLRRLAAANEGPLPDGEVMRLFREIVSTCRALEQRLVIGCMTVREACAALGHFGGAVDIRSVPDAEALLDAVGDTRLDHATIEFSQAGLASPVVAALPDHGLALCGEWYTPDGDRFVVIGREAVPPTGRDWTSFILPTRHLASVESWCRDSDLHMRATSVSDRTPSAIVDVAMHVNEPQLARFIDRFGGTVLGAYPDFRTGLDLDRE